MDRRHVAALDADQIVEHLGHRRQAVGGAGGIADHGVLGAQLVVIDAVDHGQIGAVGRGRDQHPLGTGTKMTRGLLLGGEDAGAFHDDVDAQGTPGQLRKIALGQHLDRRQTLAGGGADLKRVAFQLRFARKAAVHAIVAEQMRVGGRRREVVDRNHLDVCSALLGQCPQDVAADPAEAVDGDLGGHDGLLPWLRPTSTRAFCATCSAVIPKCSNSCLAGPLAPKPVMPTKSASLAM